MIESAAGVLTFEADSNSVTGIWFGQRGVADARLRGVAKDVRDQLSEYLAGKRQEFDLPLAFDATAFATRVLTEVAGIPWGETLSYGEVAKRAGSPRAARAVGSAVGANRFPIVVPCHRVLAANCGIGGFGGGLRWKRWLLDHESAHYVG
jgi:methylated-DNA-[protein]-cysteine S-methyltransferase